MHHLRSITALLAIAAISVACSSPASSGGGQSQAAGASQPAASSGGGGGGGAGTNGSLHYEITGDITKSGDLGFTYINGGISQYDPAQSGWVAYFYSQDQNTVVQLNSASSGGIFNFGDGEFLIVGTKDTGCTFDFSKNDASGLKGTVDCQNAVAVKTASGAQVHANVHATIDAHT